MGYSEQALLSSDQDFINRVAACAAVEIPSSTEGRNQPTSWAIAHVWTVAAAPGFADAYSSALVNQVVRPGNDPSVISDAQILAAVQAIGDTP